jgi:hypothetical protein
MTTVQTLQFDLGKVLDSIHQPAAQRPVCARIAAADAEDPDAKDSGRHSRRGRRADRSGDEAGELGLQHPSSGTLALYATCSSSTSIDGSSPPRCTRAPRRPP